MSDHYCRDVLRRALRMVRRHDVLVYAVRFLPSLLTFLAGTGALVLADVVIARFAAAPDVGQWVALKALVMVTGAIAAGGLDYILLREPSHAKDLLRWAGLNSLFCTSVVAGLAYATGYFDAVHISFLAMSGFAFSTIMAMFFRSRLRLTQAQCARDGWKILFLALIWPAYVAGGISLEWVLVFALIIGTGATLIPGSSPHGEIRQIHHEIRDYRSAMVAGLPFLMATASLAIGSYGELLLIYIFAAPKEVHSYFQAVILFAYPSVMFNAYIGLALGPEIRQSPDRARALLRSGLPKFIAAVIFLPLAALMLGRAAEVLIFPDAQIPFWLAAILSLTGAARFLYIPVSLFVGALADSRALRKIMTSYFIAALTTFPTCAAMIGLGIDVTAAVALTSLLHWLFRGSIGWRLTAKITESPYGASS